MTLNIYAIADKGEEKNRLLKKTVCGDLFSFGGPKHFSGRIIKERLE